MSTLRETFARCQGIINDWQPSLDDPHAFRSEEQKEAACALVAAFMEQATYLSECAAEHCPEHDAPVPRPELRGTPRVHG